MCEQKWMSLELQSPFLLCLPYGLCACISISGINERFEPSDDFNGGDENEQWYVTETRVYDCMNHACFWLAS